MENSDDIELLRLRALAKLKLQGQAKANSGPPEKERGLVDALFPGTLQNSDEGLSGAMKWGPQEAMDVLGAPTRALATLRGQEMSDPNAYFLRPEVQKINEREAARVNPENELAAMANIPFGEMSGTLSPSAHVASEEFAGRTLSDPLFLWQTLKGAGQALGPSVSRSGAKVYEAALKPDRNFMKKSGLDIQRDILDKGYGGGFGKNLDKAENRLDNLDQSLTDLLTERGKPVTLTQPAADVSAAPIKPKTSVNPSYEVNSPAPDVIYGEPPPGAPEGTLQIGDGRIEMGGPKPKATPPNVAITPNNVEMPNQIDPRFVKATARSTSNQPPIDDALLGEAYGIPSERNLPDLFKGSDAGALVAPADPVKEAISQALARRTEGGIQSWDAPIQTETQEAGAAGRPFVKDLTKMIDIRGNLRNTRDQMGREISNWDHAGISDDIAQGVREWESDLNNRPDGPATLLEAQKYKQGVGKIGRWNRDQSPMEIPAKARVANEFYDNIRNDIAAKVPEVTPINEEMSKLIPVKRALQDATLRTNKNNPISMTDLFSALGSVVGVNSHGARGALPGMVMGALGRASKSPQVGNMLYQTGKSMAELSPAEQAVRNAVLLKLSIPQDDQD